MSDERIASVRIYVTTTEGRPYEVDDLVDTRAELRLAIARLGALIEDELGDLLDGEPVTVEQDKDTGRTIITAHGLDAQVIPGEVNKVWLPNDDGPGDGSRLAEDVLGPSVAVFSRAIAIIHERKRKA